MASSLSVPTVAFLVLLALLLPLRHCAAIHVTTGSTRPCRVEQFPQQVITCAGGEVTEVPTVDASLKATLFYIEYSPLEIIRPDSFANLTDSLALLSIRSTVPIASFSGQAFRNLNALTQLTVVASSLQEISVELDQLLSTLGSLTFLHLENVRIGSLKDGFASGTKLVNLRLINTAIVAIDSNAFARLPSLRVLQLCKNPASNYRMSLLQQIDTVENLTMTCCGLKILSKEVADIQFSRLGSIDFSNNELTIFDLRIFASAGKTLKEINLNNNSLKADSLPGLGSMTALQRLYLTKNQMDLLPNNLGQLESLEVLEARSTPLSNIRVGDFHERSQLLSLKLDDNTKLILIEAAAFQRLSRLTELSLTLTDTKESVLVRSVSDRQPVSWSEVLAKLPSLQSLMISGLGSGQSGVLDDSVWPGLMGNKNLRRLLLDFNKITKVPDFQFAWSRLDLLSLRGNRISALNSASLYGLSPNAILQLQDNNLKSVDNCSLAHLASLSKVGLAGNSWSCDCQLVWLLNRLRAEVSNEDLQQISCKQPSGLVGRSWSDLTGVDFCPEGRPTPAACEMRQPPSTPAPTPTAFPYPLDIRLAMEPSEELLVRLTINASGLTGRFEGYTVRYGPDSQYELSNRVQDAMIPLNSLTLHLDSTQPHRFCIALKGPSGSSTVDSPTNCRIFTPTRAQQLEQVSPATISIAVIVPIVALVLIGLTIYCYLRRRARRDAVKTGVPLDEYNAYTYLDVEDPNRSARFQSARKPESRRFTKRNGAPNPLNGSRPSLNASASNLQQQLQQMQQVNQIQQMQLQQMQRIHSMSQSAISQSSSDPFSSSLPIDPGSAMRSARSTDALTSMLLAGGGGGGGGNYGVRARSQEFGLGDHPMLQRSRSGFAQYPAGHGGVDDEAPPPLPERNPSLTPLRVEEHEVYEEMDS